MTCFVKVKTRSPAIFELDQKQTLEQLTILAALGGAFLTLSLK